jgi:hypothetical protein
MGKNTRFVGLDVHAETIAVAVAEGRDQARSLGTIANRPEAVRRLLGKLGKLSDQPPGGNGCEACNWLTPSRTPRSWS